jgi:hypothetical protein
VFGTRQGDPWRHDDWGNWRGRMFARAAKASGIEGARLYDLRHSFCSLLIHKGATVVEVARQLGHAPTMTLNTYGHVFDEFQGSERRLWAEEQIREAPPSMCPFRVRRPPSRLARNRRRVQRSCNSPVGGAGLEPATSCL